MIKPKYKIGDRIGIWEVMNISFASWLDQFVYNLEAFGGRQKLTCSEESLDNVAKIVNEKSA